MLRGAEISTINEAIASNSKSILLFDLDSMWVLDALNGDRFGDWLFVSSTEPNDHFKRSIHWNDLTFNYEEPDEPYSEPPEAPK